MNWVGERIGPERARSSLSLEAVSGQRGQNRLSDRFSSRAARAFSRSLFCCNPQERSRNQRDFPEQKLTIEQALAAYTTGSAYAQFAEKEKGTIAAGMLADFVVLDRDLTKIAPPEILKTTVLSTVVGGKTVYSRAGRASYAVQSGRTNSAEFLNVLPSSGSS